jgi:hypothetical protein
MAALWPPELDKRTLRRGGATRGSFLWAKVVARGGIEGGDSVASLRRNRGEKGGNRGAGQLGRTTQRRRGGERGGSGACGAQAWGESVGRQDAGATVAVGRRDRAGERWGVWLDENGMWTDCLDPT